MNIFNKLKQLSGTKTPAAAPISQSSAESQRQAAYIAGIEADRTQKDAFFRRSPYSPLDAETRQTFSGLNYYPPNPALRLILPLMPVQPEKITIPTSTEDERMFLKWGLVEFNIEDQPVQLTLYRSEDDDSLFLPFRDATNGAETYGAGRYLEPDSLADGKVLVDFNQAYNPYCAYSHSYSCPLPPQENWLNVAIRAGEKLLKADV